MTNITRIFREQELKKAFKTLLPGTVLDVGAKNSPYLKFIPHKKYLRLDISPVARPDYVADIHKTDLPSNAFDAIIASEVLEHLYDPGKAVNEIYRMLKHGGTCVISTPAFYPFHPDPNDYFRFTTDSLNYLFRRFRTVDIRPHGNRIHLIWQILTQSFPVLNFITRFMFLYKHEDKEFPLGFIVVAEK